MKRFMTTLPKSTIIPTPAIGGAVIPPVTPVLTLPVIPEEQNVATTAKDQQTPAQPASSSDIPGYTI